ncbi:hypothetical protein AMJ85_00785 [candidate division BRC1 bacterium SM23_51]|nr:MAG: hypothetical protein AMJ85_00785 [candidate division BRC1 bacterium SM23_51]
MTGGLPQTECIAVVYKAKQTLDNYFALYFRLVGHLAQIAELVESAIGLEPWPDPPEEEEKEEDEWAVLSAMAWLIPDNLRPYSN